MYNVVSFACDTGEVREVPGEMATKLHLASDRLLADFATLQMYDIAVVAGVARSSLYYYFASKDQLLAFLLRSMLDELTNATAQAVSAPGTPSERLDAVLRAQLAHLDRHPAASRQLMANLGRTLKLPEIAAQINEGLEKPVRQLLAEGVADGTLRSVVGEESGAAALFGAVLVVGLRALLDDGHVDVDRVMEVVGDLFWHGISPPSCG